jgi:hypothetical protein
MAMGMAYVIPRATTEAAVMALKALVLPRKMKPKIRTTKLDRQRDSRGTSSLWWTRLKYLEKGSPPSRAKAGRC